MAEQKLVQRRFEISFIYDVTIDEGKILRHYSGVTDEDLRDAKLLLCAALQREDVADYLMVRKIAFDLADIGGHEKMPEVLTGYGIDDHTPAMAAFDLLPAEKRQQFSGDDGEYIVGALDGALHAELDHVHVRRLEAHEHVPELMDEHYEDGNVALFEPAVQEAPVKSRHHKQKARRKK